MLIPPPSSDAHPIPPAGPRWSLQSWGGTDVGRERSRNEDAFYHNDGLGLYVVIDGMGGTAAGDVAAETTRRLLVARVLRPEGDPEERLREGIALANNAIVRHAAEHEGCTGMGCVLTVALIEGAHLHIGHVGDTRLYRIHDDRLEKLTRDHAPIGEREERGELTEVEAMRHPDRPFVNRALGTDWTHPDDDDLIDYHAVPLPDAVRLLLCTDGVTDQVETASILKTLHSRRAAEVVPTILADANRYGGRDNATAVLIHAVRLAASAADQPVSASPSTDAPPDPVLHDASPDSP